MCAYDNLHYPFKAVCLQQLLLAKCLKAFSHSASQLHKEYEYLLLSRYACSNVCSDTKYSKETEG